MTISGKHLSRRTLLRGVGAAVALPVLDAMRPAFAAPNRLSGYAPPRLAFLYVPNGVIMPDWTPAKQGADFELTRILAPLKDFREDILVLSGLTQNNGRALGDGPGDHARAASSFLTGVHPKKTSGADIQLGVSVDQVAAGKIGGDTRIASLELGTEPGQLAGNCDSGYSCAYSNSVSWRSSTTPNPPEINPREVFERLFGRADRSGDRQERERRQAYRKSILDFVAEDSKALAKTLGPSDKRKVDEYLTAVRDIERRIESAEGSDELVPTIDRPAGIPTEFAEHARLMCDLMAVAFQADATRVATFMLGREGSNRTYREIDVPGAHHRMTHHRGDKEKIEDITKINVHHVEQLAYFLGRLAEIEEGDSNLLKQSIVVYGSGISDGNRHAHHDLPVLVAGHGGGTLKTGRHERYPDETPMNNLYLSLLGRAGVPTETLGDGTGELPGLNGV
jgi:hypothetical protein